jgi:hypothetical protein
VKPAELSQECRSLDVHTCIYYTSERIKCRNETGLVRRWEIESLIRFFLGCADESPRLSPAGIARWLGVVVVSLGGISRDVGILSVVQDGLLEIRSSDSGPSGSFDDAKVETSKHRVEVCLEILARVWKLGARD